MKKLIRVEISRAKWIRGEDDSALLTYDKRMCCLGFAAIACGFAPAQIDGVFYPAGLACKYDPETDTQAKYLGALTYQGFDTKVAETLAAVNDDEHLSAREREKRIRELGKQAGFRFVFKP